jgi:predicted transcriptional regulator
VGSLTDLLFELSSEERMAILRRLSDEPLKLSHIASRLEFTVTETSRHLQRLEDIGLIQKESDGLYTATAYATLVLSLLPGLDFTSRNRTYFSEHSMSAIPPKFRNRMGELSTGKPLKDTMTTFSFIPRMILDAKEYAFSMKDSPIPLHGYETLNVQIDNRSILQEDRVYVGERLLEGVTRRFLSKVEVFLLVTEKEALFSAPYLNGNIDYCSFMSDDPNFKNWCKELFLHFWEKAKPNPSISS